MTVYRSYYSSNSIHHKMFLKVQFLAFVPCMVISFFKLVFQYLIKIDPTRPFMYVPLVAGSLYMLPTAQSFEKMPEKALTM